MVAPGAAQPKRYTPPHMQEPTTSAAAFLSGILLLLFVIGLGYLPRITNKLANREIANRKKISEGIAKLSQKNRIQLQNFSSKIASINIIIIASLIFFVVMSKKTNNQFYEGMKYLSFIALFISSYIWRKGLNDRTK